MTIRANNKPIASDSSPLAFSIQPWLLDSRVLLAHSLLNDCSFIAHSLRDSGSVGTHMTSNSSSNYGKQNKEMRTMGETTTTLFDIIKQTLNSNVQYWHSRRPHLSDTKHTISLKEGLHWNNTRGWAKPTHCLCHWSREYSVVRVVDSRRVDSTDDAINVTQTSTVN